VHHIVDARTGIEILDRDACLTLLAADVVGRLGIVDAGTPKILPVNYVLDGDAVVFRTASGTKLRVGPRSPACFEIDTFDRASRTGWSVLVTGHLEEVGPLQHRLWSRLNELPVDPWAGGDKPHLMRLTPTHVGGRVIR
jgi:uncharacterized protein